MFNTEDITKVLALLNPAVNVIPHKKSRRVLSSAVAVAGAGMSLYSVYKSLYPDKSNESYTIKITQGGPEYGVIYKSLRTNFPPVKNVELRTESFYNIDDDYITKTYFNPAQELDMSLNWDGIDVRITLESVSGPSNSGRQVAQNQMVISCENQEDYDIIQSRLQHIITQGIQESESSSSKTNYVFRLQKDMHFTHDTTSRFARPLDSVIVDTHTKEKIMSHLKTFLDNESEYARISVPYHTGIFLYGPPGTGKTSLVSAIGAELGLSTYIINLKMIESEADLSTVARGIEPKSIVLLEDIDTITPGRTGEDKTQISLDSFLNFLDGLSTPYGMIAVMTANEHHRLDPALVRPGRMDVSAEIGYFTFDMIVEFCKQFVSDNETFISNVETLAHKLTYTDTYKITGAELLIPVKESMFLDVEGREEFMLSYLEERIKLG